MKLLFTNWTTWSKYVKDSINNIVNYEDIDCYVLKSGLLPVNLAKAKQEEISIDGRVNCTLMKKNDLNLNKTN